MSYQVLARKWRPQRFDDVIGQTPVTRTLRNAITSGRVAQAFVFAGPRGCGKTTTARILAKALSCTKGPTPDPCGDCEACVEIAQGRDIDVLEIDAASHTGIDNIREVVIAGLAIAPARNRYKIFIIDEVHQLSTASFNALLKSIEEPPPHVIFMMATTELHKIPDTILSRSQVFEFRTIPTTAIAAQLRTIADAEGIEIADAALALIARAAEGSMRDAQSAFDQVIAFAGKSIADDDVLVVLGLVGRDLLFDIIEAVMDENAPATFALADRAVEAGHDLRLVCRELTRVIRDMMVVSVDPKRVEDAEIGEAERGRLNALAGRFSREDLMRSFDILAQAEQDIRAAAQPRYHFEMALLRWMHLRKLVPLTDLIEQLSGGGGLTPPKRLNPQKTSSIGAGPSPGAARPVAAPVRETAPTDPRGAASRSASAAPAAGGAASRSSSGSPTAAMSSGALKDALLAEIRATKPFFYNTVVAQAQRIEVTDGRITFAFLPTHRALRQQFDQSRDWLESMTERLAGRRTTVVAVQTASAIGDTAGGAARGIEETAKAPPAAAATRDLKAEAMSSSAVQAMLEVFPAEISDVEEM